MELFPSDGKPVLRGPEASYGPHWDCTRRMKPAWSSAVRPLTRLAARSAGGKADMASWRRRFDFRGRKCQDAERETRDLDCTKRVVVMDGNEETMQGLVARLMMRWETRI